MPNINRTALNSSSRIKKNNSSKEKNISNLNSQTDFSQTDLFIESGRVHPIARELTFRLVKLDCLSSNALTIAVKNIIGELNELAVGSTILLKNISHDRLIQGVQLIYSYQAMSDNLKIGKGKESKVDCNDFYQLKIKTTSTENNNLNVLVNVGSFSDTSSIENSSTSKPLITIESSKINEIFQDLEELGLAMSRNEVNSFKKFIADSFELEIFRLVQEKRRNLKVDEFMAGYDFSVEWFSKIPEAKKNLARVKRDCKGCDASMRNEEILEKFKSKVNAFASNAMKYLNKDKTSGKPQYWSNYKDAMSKSRTNW